ncbi:MAG: hypothetical protein R2710_04895 [Acidimicrobiales bacterium]
MRQRSVAATPSAFNIDAGAPPAPPAPPDPFGYPGASNPNAGLWNQQGLGVPVSAPLHPQLRRRGRERRRRHRGRVVRNARAGAVDGAGALLRRSLPAVR